MSAPGESAPEASLVRAQLGRAPREPWRTAGRCAWGFPTVIASPSRLADGTPFPTYAWLTCPYLLEFVSDQESSGEVAAWAARASSDVVLAQRLRSADIALRSARADESSGQDDCVEVGLGGQRDPLGVKCLHVHVALSLAGIDDPIGEALLGKIDDERSCADDRCARLTDDAEAARVLTAPARATTEE